MLRRVLLALTLALCSLPLFAAQPTYETATQFPLATNTSETATFAGAVAAGSTILVWVPNGSVQSMTVYDSANGIGNPYTQIVPTQNTPWPGNNGFLAYYYNSVAASAGTMVIHVTTSPAAAMGIQAVAYTGGTITGTPQITGVYQPGSGANVSTSGTTTPAVNSATIVGLVLSVDNFTPVNAGTSPNAFTSESLQSGNLFQDFTQTTAAAIQSTAGFTTTLSGVTITGTAGQFSCTASTLVVGQYIKIAGTYGGTGSITGYTNPTTYMISATNGTTTFTLQTTGAVAITTTAGTPTGLTYTFIPESSVNNLVVALAPPSPSGPIISKFGGSVFP